MPRPPRLHVKGALYYVSSRAVDGGVLFRDARDYETYLELLKRAQQETGAFKCFGFVLLPDHLHLLLELTGETTISEIMHAVHSRYTKYVLKRDRRSGHVFQERFKSTVAEKAPSLLRLLGYLHTAPVRSGVVGDLRSHAWSSYLGYLAGGDSTIGPNLHGEVQEVLGRLAAERPGWTYELYLHAIPVEVWEQVRVELQQRVIGSPDFLASVDTSKPVVAVASGLRPPASGASRPRFSMALTGSLVVALVSLAAASLYAQNLSTLKQTVQVLAQERVVSFMETVGKIHASDSTGARLAAFSPTVGLEGTAWSIQLMPMSVSASSAAVTDHLTFLDNQVAVQSLADQGFARSNYTLTTQPNGTVVWETMQRNAAGEVVLWRGELRNGSMRGVVSRQTNSKGPENFTFIGQSAGAHHEEI